MTARDRQALLAGGVIVAAAWLGLRSVPRWRTEVRALEEEVAQEQRLVLGMRTELAGRHVWRDSVAVLEAATGDLSSVLLPVRSQPDAVQMMHAVLAVATAPLQATVQDITSVPDGMRLGPLTRVRFRLPLETDLSGILSLLGTLDEDSTLSVLSVAVQTVDPGSPPARPERLQVTLDVVAWYAEAQPSDTVAGPQRVARRRASPSVREPR